MSTHGDVDATADSETAVLRRIGQFSWSALGIIALIGVVAFLIIEARIILAPLFLAMVVVFILNPLVSMLERMRIHRILGTTLGFLIIIAALVVAVALVIPSVVEQGQMFASDFPDLYDDLTEQTITIAERFNIDVSIWDYDRIVEFLNDPENQDTIVSLILDRVGSFTSGIFEFILIFLLGPVLAFYFLLDLPNQQGRLLELVPGSHRAEAAFVGRQLNTAVGGFLRGQLLVAILVGLMLSIGYGVIDLPFWLLIGLVGGVLNIVPFLGPWVGGILGVIVALATTDLRTAFWAAVVAIVVQQIDNNFVSPLVLRATVRLHPAVTLSVLVLAGAVAGFWGIIIAVPLAASVKVVGGHLWRTRLLGQTWEEAGEAIMAEPPPPSGALRFRTREMEAISVDSDEVTEPDGDADADEND
ncbi:MAG: AI-2E family transporter [Acidobacteria bacterium]|nr:AI-2E family transporter [Acidobacteriota bacterium]